MEDEHEDHAHYVRHTGKFPTKEQVLETIAQHNTKVLGTFVKGGTCSKRVLSEYFPEATNLDDIIQELLKGGHIKYIYGIKGDPEGYTFLAWGDLY